MEIQISKKRRISGGPWAVCCLLAGGWFDSGWQACGLAGVLVMAVRLNETGSPGGKFCLRVRLAMERPECQTAMVAFGNPAGQSDA